MNKKENIRNRRKIEDLYESNENFLTYENDDEQLLGISPRSNRTEISFNQSYDEDEFENFIEKKIEPNKNDIYNMAMKLKELGVIDGIGMQSHLDVGYPSASVYKTALEKFISTGLEVQITELDITTNNFSSQASLYKEIFQLAVNNKNYITALTVWGTNDSISWRRN